MAYTTAYTTAAKVASEAKIASTGFTTSTTPTLAQVTALINEASAEIDGKLGLRFSLPITDETDLMVLQSIATMLVTERVRETIEVQAANGGSYLQNPASRAAKAARDRLQDIVDGKFNFNSTLISSADGIGYETDSKAEPYFQRGIKQW
jgi:hypothetical protein